MAPIICKRFVINFSEPVEKTIECHNIQEYNVTKETKFSVNPCAHEGNAHCSGLFFEFCTFYEFPSVTSILRHCPQITMLNIYRSKLSRIQADDLEGLVNLKELRIAYCELEYLSGDLFKYTPNLEIISFKGNKIKYVGKGLLTPLKSLKYFNVRNNSGIDYCFNNTSTNVGGSLDELETKLNEMKSYLILREEMKADKKLIESLKNQVQRFQEAAMNFVVKVNGKEFKAQKQVLQAQSKVLKELIDANPEILELTEISEDILVEILNFMHLGSAPNENVDLVELFSVSCRFKIEALTPIVAQILQEKVNPENALRVLILCNKYKDHAHLKVKAFDEFKKNFPLFTIKAQYINNPEKLKQMMKTKIEFYKAMSVHHH